ncbi:multiheme c-type cytochrome [Enhygromyxa salina]|uniref:Beta-barrel assembly-enhancing protease n=1 Tax=Enhygromyxa salina TaxID=215803 RepID=A0A2S9XLL1_9BACT|nr:multiheme c-type cytochrome [Enhygromyxa salina]PRP93620.1 Beta-barrel assembly-enhancing protease [Enhygromyxa salina]
MTGVRRFTWVPVAGLTLAIGCHQAPIEEPRDRPDPEQPRSAIDGEPPVADAERPIVAPFVHAAPTRFAPSLTAIAAGEHPPTGAQVADYDNCASCHEEIAAQWRISAHSFASFNNPIYRVSIDRFREQDQGGARSRFCAGCHDPALLVDGDMDADIATSEPRAHVGVGCVSCHGVASSTRDGNGSYTLSSEQIPIPELDDEASIERHRSAMGPAREQCSACHRAFIGVATGHPHHLGGTDEPGPWQDSSYAGNKLRFDTPIAEKHCADCHMPRETVDNATDPAIDEQGQLRSHRFLGGHTYLAAMRGDASTLARIQAFLRGVASVDIAAIELGGQRHLLGHGADPDALGDAGGRMVVDLVVRNLAVGHRFPGGTRDAQDTWIALQVLDAGGNVIATLDETHGEVHRLRTGVVDEDGKLVDAREVERLRAVAFDQTVGPRDAVVVRYAVQLPPGAVGPLRVEAQLLHRSRTLELADQTCKQSQTERGQAFLQATAKLIGQRLDPCVELPVTEVSRAALSLSGGTEPQARPDHERLWELGMALYHQVQERLPEAREALAAAEAALARAGLPPAERDNAEARILAALGAVAARQGRVDEALALADRVAKLAPGHPYPHLLRGRALAQVWRWAQAVPHLERALAASPGSPKLAAELATACGSAGLHRRALEVASAALALRPRDAALLRTQGLALQALGDPRAQAAMDAYFVHREPDDQPHLAAKCGERDPACARERIPVHVHE